MKEYFVYILTNKLNNVLYVGVTNNIIKRIYEHKNKLADGFTSKYNVDKLVYYESSVDVRSAIKREKQLKNWHREWKDNLITSFNNEWDDLYNIFIDPETSSG